MNVNVTTLAAVSLVCMLFLPFMAYRMAMKRKVNGVFWSLITFVFSIFGIFGFVPIVILFFKKASAEHVQYKAS